MSYATTQLRPVVLLSNFAPAVRPCTPSQSGEEESCHRAHAIGRTYAGGERPQTHRRDRCPPGFETQWLKMFPYGALEFKIQDVPPFRTVIKDEVKILMRLDHASGGMWG